MRKTVVIAHGHLYLFWTTGVYYTNELSKNYRVVLVVPVEYKNNDKFINFCNMASVCDIVYYNNGIKNVISRHFYLSKIFRKIISKYNPVAVVQHDYIGIENMYLFHWTKKLLSNCKRIVILTSMPSNENTSTILSQFRAIRINKISKKYKLPNYIVSYLYTAAKLLVNIINNKLLPILVIKKSYFPLSLVNNIDIIPKSILFDYFLIYEKCEKLYLDNLLKNSNQAKLIECPVVNNQEVNIKLYNSHEENIIVFLPSLIAHRSNHEEKAMIDNWIKAIISLHQLFPGFELIMKFHPGNISQNVNNIKNIIKEKCDFIKYVDSSVLSEELILKSKIIVGDVSTTLWWARHLNNKVVISIDMHYYATSSVMKRYNNVIYIDNVENIPSEYNKHIIQKSSKKLNIPSLTEFFDSLLSTESQ